MFTGLNIWFFPRAHLLVHLFVRLCKNPHAVDALDQVRYVIGDEEDFKPPEIRRQLMRIHKLASKRHTGGYRLTDEEVEELADLIDETISNRGQHCMTMNHEAVTPSHLVADPPS